MEHVEAGDWVCFQQLGSPSYGLVLYVIPCPSDSDYTRAVTSCGECFAKDILEVRKKGQP